MTTRPLIMIGSSRIALYFVPTFAESASMSSVSRTLSIVPCGMVTGLGVAAGSGAFAAAGGGAAGGFGVKSRPATSSTGNCATWPLARSRRTTVASPLRNDPVTLWPLRRRTLSAKRVEVMAPSATPMTISRAICFSMVILLLDDRQRRRDLQVDDHQHLVFDLEEARRRFSGRRALHAVVVLHLQVLTLAFELERAFGDPVGDGVGQRFEVIGVIGDQPYPLVVDRVQLRVVLPVNRPERLVLGLREVHHAGHDGDLRRAHIRAEQLDVGADVGVARIDLVVTCGRLRLRRSRR